MKVAFRKLLQSNGSLANLFLAPDVPGKIKLRVKRVVKQVNTELKSFGEVEEELYQRFGTKDEKAGKYVWRDDEAAKQVNKEYQELLDQEVDIIFDTFSEESLADIKELSARDLLDLEWMTGEANVDDQSKVSA
jgi:hypothetical protein